MLDVVRRRPCRNLIAAPTVIQLEAMGDDADKAFVMGLLLVRLAEHRRRSGPASTSSTCSSSKRLTAFSPRHHRGPRRKWRIHADRLWRRSAISSRRSALYGQGVIIADQIPTRLAPDVIKNTKLKVAHCAWSPPTIGSMAASMAMNEQQAVSLASSPSDRLRCSAMAMMRRCWRKCRR